MLPLLRSSLAPRGQTPILPYRVHHREKVSVAAVLTLSPERGHLGLYAQDLPRAYFDAELYAWFLQQLLRQIRGPLLLLHDGNMLHKGEDLQRLQARHPRLQVHLLPPCAPELNPVESLWNYLKDKQLANCPPQSIPHLQQTIQQQLALVRQDQSRLKSFFLSTPLPWSGTSLQKRHN